MGIPGSMIVSGGQTGAERAALDFAISQGISHGGWCPKGRKAEDGVIDPRYQLKETPGTNRSECKECNVRDSDGTVVFSIAPTLAGRFERTKEFAQHHMKPLLHLSRQAEPPSPEYALLNFIRGHSIVALNVTGPTASQEPELGAFVSSVLEATWEAAGSPSKRTIFSAAFRETLRLGKYTQWAEFLTEEQLDGLFWAIGEYGYRASPLLGVLQEDMVVNPSLGRAIVGLEIIAEICSGLRLERDEVTARIRQSVHETKAAFGSNTPDKTNRNRRKKPVESGFGILEAARRLDKLGHTAQARDALLSILRWSKPNAIILYHLARYCCRLGEVVQARDWLAQAFEAAESTAETDRLKLRALDHADLEPLWRNIGGE